ncbi:MAG TPA: hydrogenase nickel incorporation protein HypB [Streptosporangiaceae bacterium]|nr:hydrogenase nickel incorporation protein HypB [Streptosporangiaceae bacterium]
MCGTCGCGEGYRLDGQLRHEHDGLAHTHGEHGHEHDGLSRETAGSGGQTVLLQEKVLAKNDALAARNREWLRQRGVLAVNLMSSPGSGKTTLLERTAAGQAGAAISVIEGDQETDLDASRIRAAGCRVRQINTGTGCHLDAAMVADGLRALDPPAGSLLVIENVGNLVCPALFDLGETARVVLASVTEGADKPVKYPHMFRRADLVLITKADLLPYLDFDVAQCRAWIGQVAPRATVLELSARTGDGMRAWYDWLAGHGQPPPSG